MLLIAIIGSLAASCESAPTAPTAEVQQVLAPGGKLRVGLYPGSPGSMIRDPASGETKGIGYELGRELARRLGVPFEPVILPATPQILEALISGEVDVAFAGATPARAKNMDFSPPYLEVEDGFLVHSGSPVFTLADVDRTGIRLGVVRGSTSDGRFSRELKNATVVRASSIVEAIEMLSSRRVDAFATNKANLYEISDRLPGSRVLEGAIAVEGISIGVPKGNHVGAAYVRRFAALAWRTCAGSSRK